MVKKSSSRKRKINEKIISTHYVLICNRNRWRPSNSIGLRSSSTAKIDCPFKATAKTWKNKTAYELTKLMVTMNTITNHLYILPRIHLTEKESLYKKVWLKLFQSDVKFWQGRSITLYVMSILRKKRFFTLRDIYNDRNSTKNIFLEGFSGTQA